MFQIKLFVMHQLKHDFSGILFYFLFIEVYLISESIFIKRI